MPRFQNTVRNTPLIDLTSFRNTPRMIITQRNTPFTAQFRSMIFGNKQTQETIRYFINKHEKPGKSGFFVAFLRSFHYKMSERFCDTNLKKCFLFFKFRKSKKKYRNRQCFHNFVGPSVYHFLYIVSTRTNLSFLSYLKSLGMQKNSCFLHYCMNY